MAITIETLRRIDGPNVWAHVPVTHLRVEADSLFSGDPDDRPLLAERLTALLSDFVAPAFDAVRMELIAFAGVRDPATLAGMFVLNLLRLAGFPVGFCAAVTPAEKGRRVEFVVEHGDDLIGTAACRLAAYMLDQLESGDVSPSQLLRTEVARFAMLASTRRLALDLRTTVSAARQRGIPVSRLDASGRIIELGNGAFRRRIHGSISSLTSAIAESICENKHLTNHYLRSAGLPVPDGRLVRTIEQALAAAHDVGFPVAVKPVDCGAAIGVSLDLRNDDEVRDALPPAVAASQSGDALVESYIAGNEYRAVVVNDQIVAVTERIPAHVVGDGAHTVQDLLDLANADPRRGTRETDRLRPIVVDAITIDLLHRQALDLDSIPEAGQIVRLKPHAQVPGNVPIDRTDDVHPDNAAIIRQAVRMLDLDVASVDFVAHDVAESIWTTRGAIVDINARSGFKSILYPAEGLPHDPGPPIVDMLFPPDRPVRAALVAVIGDDRTSGSISRLLAHILTANGDAVGLASAGGLLVEGRPVRGANPLHPAGVRTLLNNPSTETVVAEINPQSIVDHGLGFDYCDVAVVTSLSGLTRPNGRPVETVLTELIGSNGVLVVNAADPGATSLARERGESVVYFGIDILTADLRSLLEDGAKAVTLLQPPGGATISLTVRNEVVDIAPAFTHTLVAGLPHPLATQAILAAIAAAVARAVPIDSLCRSLF